MKLFKNKNNILMLIILSFLYISLDTASAAKLKEPILKGDVYFNAFDNKILICDVDDFFDPWSLKVVEIPKNNV